jgi:hypothetical protein
MIADGRQSVRKPSSRIGTNRLFYRMYVKLLCHGVLRGDGELMKRRLGLVCMVTLLEPTGNNVSGLCFT